MNATISTRSTTPGLNIHCYTRAAILMAVLAAACACGSSAASFGGETPLLSGRVSSSSGGSLAGIPVRAHRQNSNMTVSVYTNSRGEYSFPEWSDVAPGSYDVAIELPDFEHVNREAVLLTAEKTAPLDFTLESRQPSLSEATAAEITMALPGNNHMKSLLVQCSVCHSLQWALKNPHTKKEWVEIISRMAGQRRISRNAPGTNAYGQKRFLEPLAEYLASIRGPGSSDQLPFQLRPANGRGFHEYCGDRVRHSPGRASGALYDTRGPAVCMAHDIIVMRTMAGTRTTSPMFWAGSIRRPVK